MTRSDWIAVALLAWLGLAAIVVAAAGVIIERHRRLKVDDLAADVELLCHWRQNRDGIAEQVTHRGFHFGDFPGQAGICPYEVVAEVLRGRPDSREAHLTQQGGAR